jgi:endonuclease YncB( thermonuclease family)
MRRGLAWLVTASLALALAVVTPPAAKAYDADIVGAAAVLSDGSLRIGGNIVRLYGIYIPVGGQFGGQTCQFVFNPARCGSRAALALDSRIEGFVFCRSVDYNSDGSVNAICYIRGTFYGRGEDLAAFLVGEGLAFALPGAPFEYVALERVAQSRQLGLWGFPVDAIRRRW